MSSQPANDLMDLRTYLVRQADAATERKVRAYEASDTLREAHLDGQIVALRHALARLDTIIRTERA